MEDDEFMRKHGGARRFLTSWREEAGEVCSRQLESLRLLILLEAADCCML